MIMDTKNNKDNGFKSSPSTLDLTRVSSAQFHCCLKATPCMLCTVNEHATAFEFDLGPIVVKD